jgi:mono/diheme cytochrome c family protein
MYDMKRNLLISSILVLVSLFVTQCQQPRPKAEASGDEGATLFLHYCAACHLDNGIGGPAPGGGLNAPDIRQFTKSASELSVIITNGFGKMPAFKDSTTTDNISKIAAYVSRDIELHSSSANAANPDGGAQ